MVRVVQPGGLVATYMWDLLGGGLPQAPFRTAAEAIEVPFGPPPPGSEVTQRNALDDIWREAGLDAVETRRIDIGVVYEDFEDFWDSNLGLGTPTAQMVNSLSSVDVGRLKDWLRENLPRDEQGRITYGAHANAVKGRVT